MNDGSVRSMAKNMNMRKSKFAFNVVFIMLFVFLIFVMLVRTLFGIEITDEAYYVAEGRTVLEGNLPYALNNSNTVGMTLLMIPFIWIYRFIVPDYEGLFLYMRIGYVVFKSVLALIGFQLLKKKVGDFFAACSSLTMLAYHINIQNFSYNSIPAALVYFIGVVLLYLQDNMNNCGYEWAGYAIAGYLSAIVVFAHPAHATTVLLFIIFLILFNVGIKSIFAFIMGGILQIVVLFLPIISQTGIDALLQGILEYRHNVSIIERAKPSEVINNIWSEYGQIWKIMIFGVLFFIFASFIIKRKIKYANEVRSLKDRDERKKIILGAAFFSLILGLIYIFIHIDVSVEIASIGACAVFVEVILLFFFPKDEAVWFIGVPNICFCFFEAFMTNSNSVGSRFVYAVPALCVLFICAGNLCKVNKYEYAYNDQSVGEKITLQSVGKYSFAVFTVGVIIACEINGLRYVYRDSPLEELKYKVSQGIYKGIYTSKQNAEDTMELEKYIKNHTNSDELIAFRDNVPVGYLFMNGKICDIRTWDCMQYSYGRNDPSALYAYYERSGNTPDKIIYIDFGQDESLSIDDKEYLYNTFVHEKYFLDEEIHLNDTYKKVIIYKKTEDEK